MHNDHNKNDIFEFLITPSLKNTSYNDILANVEKISNIIPNCVTVNDLINDPSNNKPKEYVAYDQYIHHNKYAKHEEQKFDFVYNDKSLDFCNNYIKYTFMKLCAWLLNEIEKMVSRITNQYSATNIDKTTKNTYNYYFESHACFENENIYCFKKSIRWNDFGLLSPYNHVKKSMETKGYHINLTIDENNKHEYYTLVLSIPNKRNRD
jgi:hypothetical protein